jgi:hypothetical protein
MLLRLVRDERIPYYEQCLATLPPKLAFSLNFYIHRVFDSGEKRVFLKIYFSPYID